MNATEIQSNAAAATLSDLSSSDKHCVFRCGASWYSVPAVSVREISIAPQLFRVPHCHRSLVGLCHLRSEFVPVLSLPALLEVDSASEVSRHDRLLVLGGSNVWALQIDEAAALESMETLVTPEPRLDDVRFTAVMGTAMHRDQIVRVLNPNRLYQLAQQVLDGMWGRSKQPTANRPE